ncbi:MAG: xanthine dehydrogenase family protein molybdopterin-binding subunit [Anaerolineaceae bacterium]|nr:xanthine dehydrogenase family protein molybdopterin-binding subunit [Anaerolineaceae bacterium]
MALGKSLKRVDAFAKVKGEAKYPGDISLSDPVYLKILFSERAHAVVKKIDASEAESIQGVIGVLTAKDVPVNEYGLILPDQPVLCGPGSDKPFADRVRFIGDQVAVILAETEEIATTAIKKVYVEYDDLPVLTDPRIAKEPDAILLHPDHGTNTIISYRIRRGDVESAFSESDIVVESYYQTPAQEHAYLQPEAGVGYLDEEQRVTIAASGQWAHEEQKQIAHALNLPLDQVRLIHPVIGGAFGGREDISIQIVLGLAVLYLKSKGVNRPVKIIWSRDESIIGHGKRHPYYMKTRWGAKNDGKLTAAEVEIIADGGAYVYTSNKVLGNATLMCTGPYEIPNIKVDTSVIYTNNLPGAAFRGFGGPQGTFLAENQMNKLAAELGMDPVEIRARNLLRDGVPTSTGTPLPNGVSIDKVVSDCALAASWEKVDEQWTRKSGYSTDLPDQQHLKRGVGFACTFKNVGFSFGAPEQCTATIELHGDIDIDYAVLHHAGAEVGQGSHTAFIQMAATALGLPVEKIKLISADTTQTQNSGSVSASRMTFMAGNSIIGAAEKAMEKWLNEERPAIATYQYLPPRTTPLDPETGQSNPNFSYGYVAEAVEVEVDIETGEIRLIKVVCSVDVGKAINPQQIQGQIEGAVVQASGYALLENFIQEDGIVLTKTFSTYLIPTVLDIPEEVESRILEFADPRGPWGARGMGEMPYLPLTPAIVAGIYQATGVWFDRFPLTPERVSLKLADHLGKIESVQ